LNKKAMLPTRTAPSAPWLSSLNPAQRAAVEATEGPLLVLAGAGTGKTQVLTTRLAHLIATNRARPHEILAVTFTNKAAREMKERLGHLMGASVEGMWLGTFHSVCVRMLRQHAERVGLTSTFTILDTDDQLRLLKQLIQAAGYDEKRLPPRLVLSIIQRWKDKALTPERVPLSDASHGAGAQALKIYHAYQERLANLNATDFGDLLLLTLGVLQKHPDALAAYHQRFKYILVDEYQDTNVAQYLWLRLLAQGHGNLCCVGDDDQSIYGWRGAEVENILRFEEDFPGAQIIRLEQNYRSTPHILGAAGGLIHHNRGRLGKTLWTETDHGEPVQVQSCWDGQEEARTIANTIEDLQRAGTSLSDMAILVRAGYQTREFEERLLAVGIPYRLVGGQRFYDRQEIRDALAYLRLVHQPRDDLAFERIINTPKRGLGDAVLQDLHIRVRYEQGLSLSDAAMQAVRTESIRPQARRALGQFLDDLARWRSQLNTMPHAELAQTVLDESGYTEMWKNDTSPEAPGRLENLRELVRAMEDYSSLSEFIEHVSLVADNTAEAAQEAAGIMTLHAAKGLEFRAVFLPGWEEGVFPNPRALEESGETGLEEERRLAYVGITRARERAYIYHASSRKIFGHWQSLAPSRFLAELPAEHIVREGLSGAETGTAGTWGRGSGNVGSNGSWSTLERSDNPAFNRYRERGEPVLELSASRSSSAAGRYSGNDTGNSGYNTGSRSGSTPAIRKPSTAFRPGDAVTHETFGTGRITAVQGQHLEVAFDSAGSRKVIAGFVKRV
jgi:DNA helicase II / ATP-dependent DNA helicase PcrA